MFRNTFKSSVFRVSARRFQSNISDKSRKAASRSSTWNTILLVGGLSTGYLLAKTTDKGNISATTSITSLESISTPDYAQGSVLKQGYKQIELILKSDSYSSNKDEFANYALTEEVKSDLNSFIVYPESTQDVSEILKIAYAYRIPVFPLSGNTSVQGQKSINKNGIILDLHKLDHIVQINEQDQDVVVQPGVSWNDLNEALSSKGLFYSAVPGPGAKVGGFINTSSSSPNSTRYGTTKENVLNLTVVLADGTIIKTQNRPPKSSNGYNLTNLFVGSEGTLGVITEATLKVNPILQHERVTIASFKTLKDATNAISSLKKYGLNTEEVQLVDSNLIDVVNQSGMVKNQLPVNPTLFIKVADNDESVLKSQIKSVESIVKSNNSTKYSSSWNKDSTKDLWTPVKLIYPASFKYAKSKIPNAKLFLTLDVTVPVSNLAELIEETTKEFDQDGLYIGGYSRSDAGNFLPIVLYDPLKQDAIEKISKNLQERALKLDGSISGQYGIGLAKRNLLVKEIGQNGIDLERKLKLSLDPLGILNPGKIIQIDPNEK